ncbi:MAG: beta-galactosidase trimerization domain-containing protein, partial [Candidatus Brocadiae bacterium]|nr:beta-galactosidase trimerization domain-containing protein [Candidatus Brocadiia bacterium]
QAAARGAELVSYFRWRTCAFAQEMHWYGMLDADGIPGRRYHELKATIAGLKGKSHLWEDRLPHTPVAMVLDYHAHWALEADSMAADLDYLGQFRALYGLLRRRGQAVRVVQPGQELTGHALVVVPMPLLAREADVTRWQEFLGQGGLLLVTAPAGYRTEHNTWLMEPAPGPLAEVLGVRVAEHDMLRDGAANRVVFDDAEFPAGGFCSILELGGAEAVASYGGQYYAGRPAVTRRSEGQGRAYFLGASGTPELYQHLLDMLLEESGVGAHPWSSETIETVPLKTGQGEPAVAFVLNHSEQPAQLPLPEKTTYRDLLTGQEHSGTMALDGYGVVLLEG